MRPWGNVSNPAGHALGMTGPLLSFLAIEGDLPTVAGCIGDSMT